MTDLAFDRCKKPADHIFRGASCAAHRTLRLFARIWDSIEVAIEFPVLESALESKMRRFEDLLAMWLDGDVRRIIAATPNWRALDTGRSD